MTNNHWYKSNRLAGWWRFAIAITLFMFYMVTDPGTTPSKPLDQLLFGGCVAAVYGLLMVNHIVFGFFFALTLICTLRGLGIYARTLTSISPKVLLPTPTAVGEV